jgi:Leucine-rich repeat (LRR) protein
MSHNSVTSCETKGVSTVCTLVLLCVVTFALRHHQTAAEDIECAAGCRCYDNIANCSHIGVGVVPHWDRFIVGLLELDLTGNRIDSLNDSGLKDFVSVRNMIFRNNTIKNVHPRAFQGLSESLLYLDLSSNMIHTIDSITFSLIPNLEVLLIYHNSIAVLENTLFSDLTELRQLDVSFNYVSQVSDGTFENNSRLEFLSLRHNDIDSISKTTFRAQHNLTHLDLSHNKISVIVQDAFLALQQLEWLSVTQNNIKEVSTNLCESVKQVLHLNLSANAIDCIKPRSFSQCSRLQTLSIAHNQVSELPQQALFGLFSLTYLDLSHNKLTHFGPEVFDAP